MRPRRDATNSSPNQGKQRHAFSRFIRETEACDECILKEAT